METGLILIIVFFVIIFLVLACFGPAFDFTMEILDNKRNKNNLEQNTRIKNNTDHILKNVNRSKANLTKFNKSNPIHQSRVRGKSFNSTLSLQSTKTSHQRRLSNSNSPAKVSSQFKYKS